MSKLILAEPPRVTVKLTYITSGRMNPKDTVEQREWVLPSMNRVNIHDAQFDKYDRFVGLFALVHAYEAHKNKLITAERYMKLHEMLLSEQEEDVRFAIEILRSIDDGE